MAACAVRGALTGAQGYLGKNLVQRVGYDLRLAFYEQLQRLSFSFHDQRHSGDLIARGMLDLEGVRAFLESGVLRAITLSLRVGGGRLAAAARRCGARPAGAELRALRGGAPAGSSSKAATTRCCGWAGCTRSCMRAAAPRSTTMPALPTPCAPPPPHSFRLSLSKLGVLLPLVQTVEARPTNRKII